MASLFYVGCYIDRRRMVSCRVSLMENPYALPEEWEGKERFFSGIQFANTTVRHR